MMENREKTENQEMNKKQVLVDLDWLAQLLMDVKALASMQLEFISLFQKESALKKSHKAYLHVREYAERICERNLCILDQITMRYSVPTELITNELVEEMQEDVALLVAEVDYFVEMFEEMKDGVFYPEEFVERHLKEASEISEEIFEKWNNR